MTFNISDDIEVELVEATSQTGDVEYKPIKLSHAEGGINLYLNQSSSNLNHNNASSLAQNLVSDKGDGMVKLIAKELLLNILIPERLLANAKAIFYIAIAYTVLSFDYHEMMNLLRIVASN